VTAARDASDALARAGEARVDDRLLDAGEVAELLNVPVRWVRDATRDGRIPCLRLGRYVRYRRGAVLGWLDSLESRPQRRPRPRQYQGAVPNGR
jgi:excisionase family DNA binding protein